MLKKGIIGFEMSGRYEGGYTELHKAYCEMFG